MYKIIKTNNAPLAENAPFSQAVQKGSFVFVSGQIGKNPKNNQLVAGFEKQAKQALDNMFAILKEAGCNEENVVKVTVFLDDINNFAMFNNIYKEYFSDQLPARSAFEVNHLAASAQVEIDAIAML
jgi:2-iminobutanoate/2-iminopropanoate deaminase